MLWVLIRIASLYRKPCNIVVRPRHNTINFLQDTGRGCKCTGTQLALDFQWWCLAAQRSPTVTQHAHLLSPHLFFFILLFQSRFINSPEPQARQVSIFSIPYQWSCGRQSTIFKDLQNLKSHILCGASFERGGGVGRGIWVT